jgi:hypothetical protein
MFHVSELFLTIIFLCFSTGLFGMHGNIVKVLAATDLDQIEELLNTNSSSASSIATGALCELRQCQNVSHKKVDLLIKYAEQSTLKHALDISFYNKSSYVTQQMEKKAYPTAHNSPNLDDTLVGIPEPARKKWDTDTETFRGFQVDNVYPTRHQDPSLIILALERDHQFKRDQKNRQFYLKWGSVGLGLIGLIYYLCTDKNHQQINR